MSARTEPLSMGCSQVCPPAFPAGSASSVHSLSLRHKLAAAARAVLTGTWVCCPQHRGRLTHADHFGSPGSHVFFSRRLRKLWSNLSRAVRQLDAAIVGWPSSLQSLLPCLTCSTARKGFLLLGHQHRCPGGRVSQGLPRPGAQEPPQEGTGCPADVLPRRTGAPSPRDP